MHYIKNKYFTDSGFIYYNLYGFENKQQLKYMFIERGLVKWKKD